MSQEENEFYELANEFLATADDLEDQGANPGKLSSAFMYASAQYNVAIFSTNFDSAEEMRCAKEEGMAYLVNPYQLILSAHMDNIIEDFNHSQDGS